MEIKKKIVVPTGEIYTAIGEKGMLEFLTVGDYGKNANIKADFLGITRDLNGVPNGEPMPLTEKWVITISTQYGCSMGCKFCDVPKVGIGRIEVRHHPYKARSLCSNTTYVRTQPASYFSLAALYL